MPLAFARHDFLPELPKRHRKKSRAATCLRSSGLIEEDRLPEAPGRQHQRPVRRSLPGLCCWCIACRWNEVARTLGATACEEEFKLNLDYICVMFGKSRTAVLAFLFLTV